MRKMVAVLMLLVLTVGVSGCGTEKPKGQVKDTLADMPSASTGGTKQSSEPEVEENEEETQDFSVDFTEYDSMAELLAPYGIQFGTMINYKALSNERFLELARTHFNSVTASNELKAYSLLDQKASKASKDGMPVMNYSQADEILAFAQENGIGMRGHTLVWDAYMTDWFFRKGYDSKGDYVDSKTMKKRLESYITQVITHFETNYPGVIYCWDVVNEAVGDGEGEYLADDGRHVRTMRNGADNPFYTLVGSDYVELSFLYARNAVDALKAENPNVDIKLIYNDYGTFYDKKRDAICVLIDSINTYASDEEGNPRRLCDGVGMQGYIGGYGKQAGCMNDGDISKIRTAVEMFASHDVEVHVTEMAVRNYENSDAFVNFHADYYERLFEMFLSLNEGEEKPLTGISIWGLYDRPDLSKDDYSYKMNGPYCGLFTENFEVKQAFVNIYNLLKK